MKHSAWVAAAAVTSTLAVVAVTGAALLVSHVITPPWQQASGHAGRTSHAVGLRVHLPRGTPAVSPPPPSPVSTTASLISNCVMGWEWTPNSTSAADGVFRAGARPAGTGSRDPALAYQVTLTSTSVATADVTGFAVAFYDTSGSEAGSDQEQTSGFITPGQSLSWTFIEDHTVSGYGDDPNEQLAQTGNIPAGAATCQLVQWDHP